MCARRDKCTDLEGGGGLRESPRDRMSFLLSLLLPSFRPGDALGTRSARIICVAPSPHPLSLPLWQSRIRRPMMRFPSPSRNSQWAAWLRETAKARVAWPPRIVRPAGLGRRVGPHTFHHRIWQAERPTTRSYTQGGGGRGGRRGRP